MDSILLLLFAETFPVSLGLLSVSVIVAFCESSANDSTPIINGRPDFLQDTVSKVKSLYWGRPNLVGGSDSLSDGGLGYARGRWGHVQPGLLVY